MTLVALGISVAYIYSLYAFYMNNFSSATGHTMDFLGISNLNFNYAIRTLDRNECCRKCWRCFKEMAELLPNSAIKVMDNGQRRS